MAIIVINGIEVQLSVAELIEYAQAERAANPAHHTPAHHTPPPPPIEVSEAPELQRTPSPRKFNSEAVRVELQGMGFTNVTFLQAGVRHAAGMRQYAFLVEDIMPQQCNDFLRTRNSSEIAMLNGATRIAMCIADMGMRHASVSNLKLRPINKEMWVATARYVAPMSIENIERLRVSLDTFDPKVVEKARELHLRLSRDGGAATDPRTAVIKATELINDLMPEIKPSGVGE